DMLYNLCYLTIILIIVGSRHAGRAAATARQPVRGPRRSDETRHHRSTTCPRRTERWRARGSLCHQHTCHHPALAGAGGSRIDRATDRATVALCTRACERAGADGKLARAAAGTLVGRTPAKWSGGQRPT